MKLKERFENHYVIFGLSLIAVGFISGFATRSFFLEEGSASKVVNRTISKEMLAQIKSLGEKHENRINDLHKQYLHHESEATYGGNLDSQQNKYAESANRIKALILEENESFERQIKNILVP